MPTQFRKYKDERDYKAPQNYHSKIFDPGRRFYPSLGDLDYNLAFGGETFLQNLTICEIEDGTIIGAVWPGHHRILYFFTGPEYGHLEAEIFTWIDKTTVAPLLEIALGRRFIFGVMWRICPGWRQICCMSACVVGKKPESASSISIMGECGRLIRSQMMPCVSIQGSAFKNWAICSYGVSHFMNDEIPE